MTIFEAVLLGIIEGLTEFFPISSTGHLILAQRLMGVAEPSMFFNTIIQMGAILAVIVYYHRDIIHMVRESIAEKSSKFFLLYGLATFPVLILGFVFHSLVEVLQTKVWVVGVSSLALIPFMILFEKSGRTHEKTESRFPEWLNFLRVGFAQAISIIPGISRSGATILGGLSNGWTFTEATKTAFLLGIPAMAAASAYEMVQFLKSPTELRSDIILGTAVGFIVSFFVALLTIHLTLPIFRKYGFRPFILYRALLGLGILIFLR